MFAHYRPHTADGYAGTRVFLVALLALMLACAAVLMPAGYARGEDAAGSGGDVEVSMAAAGGGASSANAAETTGVVADYGFIDNDPVLTSAEACGLGFDLPAGAQEATVGKDRAYWLRRYDDGGRLVIAVQSLPWSGADEDLASFAVASVRELAQERGAAVVDEGGWNVYGSVRAYACGYVGADALVLTVTTAIADEVAARAVFSYEGPDVAGASAADIAPALASLRIVDDPYLFEHKRGAIAYYDLLDLVGLTGAQIVEVLEEGSGLGYTEYADGDVFVACWTGADGGPLEGSNCLVYLFTRGDADGATDAETTEATGTVTELDGPAGDAVEVGDGASETIDFASTATAPFQHSDGQLDPANDAAPGEGVFATRDALLAGAALSGVEVQWLGVPPIEWDEPIDAARALQRACGFTDMLEEGYADGWYDDGSFTYARVGRCEVGGSEGFWAILVHSPGSGEQCMVTVSVDQLRNGHGGGYTDYDDLVQTLLGE